MSVDIFRPSGDTRESAPQRKLISDRLAACQAAACPHPRRGGYRAGGVKRLAATVGEGSGCAQFVHRAPAED